MWRATAGAAGWNFELVPEAQLCDQTEYLDRVEGDCKFFHWLLMHLGISGDTRVHGRYLSLGITYSEQPCPPTCQPCIKLADKEVSGVSNFLPPRLVAIGGHCFDVMSTGWTDWRWENWRRFSPPSPFICWLLPPFIFPINRYIFWYRKLVKVQLIQIHIHSGITGAGLVKTVLVLQHYLVLLVPTPNPVTIPYYPIETAIAYCLQALNLGSVIALLNYC